MIQVYIGDGQGKTTTSVGLSVRAAGHGFRVLFMQFLKDDSSGEIEAMRRFPEIKIVHCPITYGFTFQMTEEQMEETTKEYDKMLDMAITSDAFLIVLDEVIHALNAGMIKKEKLDRVLNKDCEVILTGRDAPKWIVDKGDYVSDIRKIKHPYDRGVQARIGIEF